MVTEKNNKDYLAGTLHMCAALVVLAVLAPQLVHQYFAGIIAVTALSVIIRGTVVKTVRRHFTQTS